MTDVQAFLDRLNLFDPSTSTVLVIVQCGVDWFRAANFAQTMEFEYRLATLCMKEGATFEALRLVPHNLLSADLGPKPEPIIRNYERWLESATTWLGLAQNPHNIRTQRLIQESMIEDRIAWLTGNSDDYSEVAMLAERIRSGDRMTPLVPADFAIESDPFDADPSLTL